MDGGYSQGGAPPPAHMMSYFQGVPGYNIPQSAISASTLPMNAMRSSNAVSIWAGDLDAYMDEAFLRQAVTASGWGADITRIKVVRDHYSGMHAGYGFLDAASPEAAQRVISAGSGMPIPGTNRCWRLNMGRNASATPTTVGFESNVYVGNLEPSVTDYQLMTAFRPRYASVRHAKVVCNDYGQSRGYGFVRFGNPQDADRAVSEMHGYVFNQKPIRLSAAAGRTRTAGTIPNTVVRSGTHMHYHHMATAHGHPTNKRPRQLMSPDDPNNTTIFIGGTSSHITEDLLWQEFSSFGELCAVRVPINKTGFAFVRFKGRDCAQRAKDEVSRTHFVSLNPNKPVRVEWASEQIPVRSSPAHLTASGGYGACRTGVQASGSNGYVAEMNDVVNGQVRGYTSGARTSETGSSGGKKGRNDDKANSLAESIPENADANVTDSLGEHERREGADVTSVGQGVETEPPSKRVAVGRPEYAGNGGAAVGNADKVSSDKTDCHRSDGTTEESSAMQFSWLNASSSRTASNAQ